MINVLEYIEATESANVRQLLLSAHHYLQEILPPFATCSIKWRLPFYKLHRNFCYLNRHPNHFTLGFAQGFRLAPRPDVLLDENGKLKEIRYLEIFDLETLYSEMVYEIIQEAVMVDETIRPKRSERINAHTRYRR